ncbi:MAG TPA: alcohol dehydrogenase catalytic domain-containing protein [Geminicoccus sp.]|uniref:alcohol dehydrogenase catalytic domain-containing protein n=1 Tax=Geminicoccus sp. TaxID=2024832 RepID=UPI002E3385C0|nr:alcohol dehydrogenase catalytic domain-containing protein [Geminicoccus sp.]HEX2529713.1 alcohol dehydrogenase catalytic domain-containing protein [Geminicoccus sp.]
MTDAAVPSDTIVTRTWPFAGGDIRDIGVEGRFVEQSLELPGPDEIIARVDAVCICSSDVKVIRMGTAHPLLAGRELAKDPAVLGHEMALTVLAVGERWRDQYRPGERLGLQPAILVKGSRQTIGMDLPGAFGQHIRLDARTLGGEQPYVFRVPDDVSAATVAMLEPYSCVEAAYRPNCRTTLKPGGRLLLVTGQDGGGIDLDMALPSSSVDLIAPDAKVLAWATPSQRVTTHAALEALPASGEGDGFDDIIIRGQVGQAALERLIALLAKEGMLVLVGDQPREGVAVDAARIHYHALSLVGAPGPSLAEAFSPVRNRFELKPGGIMLILGAGGAMGRIHTHRAIEMGDGPQTIIAASRKASRCQALLDDFGGLASRCGKKLVVVEDQDVEQTVRDLAPKGCDDVVVVAPDIGLIERGAGLMAPDGMLVLFSGMPFGKPCRLPIGRIATHGARFTGSTGSAVNDQLAVLGRVMNGTLDMSGNLEAVGGLAALPDALEAVTEGRVSGKIAIYPGNLDLPLTPIRHLIPSTAKGQWTRADEEQLLER